MNVTEDSLKSWPKGPSKTETDKCGNAETAVRKAIKAFDKLADLNVSVFGQGSYAARTNVRKDSDVDICVRYNSAFFPDYPEGTTQEAFGNTDSSLGFSEFKDLVHAALVDYFGAAAITRGNKAFDVHANTYRIDADVVATFEHRRYTGKTNSDGSDHYLAGVAFKPDSGSLIKNWPQQTYNNGVARNTETGRKYKRLIRILKRLNNKMQDDNVSGALGIPSFLIECLVWNAEVIAFEDDTYTKIVRHVLADLWNRTRKDEQCSECGEVNELKYLFVASQPWTRQQANTFLQAAWDYMGYK